MSAGADREIKACVYPVSTPHEQLPLAAKLNSAHGWQLTEQDKESTAKAMYRYGHTYEKIAETRAGGKAKVSEWLARTVKDDKIFDLWLACHTQEEIAKALRYAVTPTHRNNLRCAVRVKPIMQALCLFPDRYGLASDAPRVCYRLMRVRHPLIAQAFEHFQ